MLKNVDNEEVFKTTGAATPDKKVKAETFMVRQVVYLFIIHPMTGLVKSACSGRYP
jgi:hypothetical protein